MTSKEFAERILSAKVIWGTLGIDNDEIENFAPLLKELAKWRLMNEQSNCINAVNGVCKDCDFEERKKNLLASAESWKSRLGGEWKIKLVEDDSLGPGLSSMEINGKTGEIIAYIKREK